jgi:thiamine-phosphate pyrophosphorylase
MALQAACRAGGLVLLIGQDEGLALKAGADGVHLPERRLSTAAGLRRRHPDWLVTSAAHSASAIRKARSVGLDAVLVSAVFASRSPSAGRPLGVMRLAALAGSAGLPVIALGGVSARTAPQLIGTPVSGIAAVDGFRT